MGRITITLQEDEQEALWQLAGRECRDPRDQIRIMLRRELQAEGFLEATDERKRGGSRGSGDGLGGDG